MADNYLEFSEVIPNLTKAEEAWLNDQLQTISIFGDQEYPEDAVPPELAGTKPDWNGVRFLRDKTDFDPQYDALGFECSFGDDTDGWGRHLWLYTEDWGNVTNVVHLVQKFLKKFRPDECWSLTWASTCSKPRVGEFGGGAVFVTAKRTCWENAHDFIDRKRVTFQAKNTLIQRRKGKA